MKYKYITDNNLEHTQNYMYTEYTGEQFLEEYLESRPPYIQMVTNTAHISAAIDTLLHESSSNAESYIALKQLCHDADDAHTAFPVEEVNIFQKRFEVKKRLFSSYKNAVSTANIGTEYDDLTLYLLLSYLLVRAYQTTESISYFSTFLKINDTLISCAERMSAEQREVLIHLLKMEVEHAAQLSKLLKP